MDSGFKKNRMPCRQETNPCDKGVRSAVKNPPTSKPLFRFDFEVGYLVKSPCKNCEQRTGFPGCDEACEILRKIHGRLTNNVSCTKHG